MLSFDSSLTDALTSHATDAFFTLKVFYNAEGATDVIHLSDQDRVDGSDNYYGLVVSWGSVTHSLDFFNFTTSIANTTIRLINTDNTIQGGRFSDLFSTLNFANRKWELFVNTSSAGTYDTDARKIGMGIISGDIKYDVDFVSLTLLDFGGRQHAKVPTNVVSSGANTRAFNINKPIPMAYGDCTERTDIGTVPSGAANFSIHKLFNRSAFPAIITDEWEASSGLTEATPDSVTMNALDASKIYYYDRDFYSFCNGNATINNATPLITFKGSSWKIYVPLHATGASAQSRDSDFSTSDNLTANNNVVTFTYAMPELPVLGTYVGIRALLNYGTKTGDDIQIGAGDLFEIYNAASPGVALDMPDPADESVDISGEWTANQRTAWDFSTTLTIQLDMSGSGGATVVPIIEVGVEIEYTPDKILTQDYTELVEVAAPNHMLLGFIPVAAGNVEKEVWKTRTVRIATPFKADYIYWSGKGREYGDWIDDIDGGTDNRTDHNGSEPDPNYTAGDLIENPVYIIEDILRTELGMDAGVDGSDIDIESFDRAGNAQLDGTRGDISFIYNDAIADIKFAFSQFRFINSKDLINRICSQILSWVFLGGDGKFKIKTLRRPTDYASADKTIDFKDIDLKSISRTALGSVRNDITVNYGYDYAQGQFNLQANDTDATSQGATVDGVSQALVLEIDADILDPDTAGATAGKGMADAYVAIFKDRKVILEFDCKRPKYLDLEITDIIDFENWDSSISIYGDAMVNSTGDNTADYYTIQQISKRPNGCSIKAIKVS